MKCRQCANPVRVNYSGHCSTTCRDFKPRPKKVLKAVDLEGVIYVDASDEEVIPLHLKQPSKSREELIREFKELRNE